MEVLKANSEKYAECICTECDLRSMFFENVGQNEMQRICATKEQIFFRKGEEIIKEGEKIVNFTYLKSGLVKLFRSSGDKEQIIHIAKPFDFVSILSVFSKKTYQYSVSALDDSVLCHIDMKDMFEMSESNAAFAMDLMKRMSEVSDRIILEMLEVKQRNLRGRVAFMLLYFSDTIFKSDAFELPVSRKEIAEYIGMSTENVIRTLSEFRKDEVIKIFGKIIEITDKPGLEMISKHG